MFCGHANQHPEQFADTALESYPELATKVIEYVEPQGQVSRLLIRVEHARRVEEARAEPVRSDRVGQREHALGPKVP